ncbi:hypothetical protein CPB83DRAFT_856542 [Crepidotus variabilis]|uniref:Uncharacterized protein n=1 Tax=Crepidotus variabilis TaxID=179855 RepID=A0A9P6EDX2_9AGAR|nr:hypothetical protein CPB83DRAFT_856542 [Crepidotus variabilis]
MIDSPSDPFQNAVLTSQADVAAEIEAATTGSFVSVPAADIGSPVPKPKPLAEEPIIEQNRAHSPARRSTSVGVTAPPFYTSEGYSYQSLEADQKRNHTLPNSRGFPGDDYSPSPSALVYTDEPRQGTTRQVADASGAYRTSTAQSLQYTYAATPPGYSTALASTTYPSSISALPPPSFSRPPPPRGVSSLLSCSYAKFKPIFVVARGNGGRRLHKGFTMGLPPYPQVTSAAREGFEGSHPFVTHDVNEVDWMQFLTHLRAAGALTEKDKRRSSVPIINWIPIINELTVYSVQQIMQLNKKSNVAKVVDDWNHHFFEPRKARVILMRGSTKLSGRDERPIGELYSPPQAQALPFDFPETSAEAGHFRLEDDEELLVGQQVRRWSWFGQRNGNVDETTMTTLKKGKKKEVNKDNVYRLFVVPL